MSIMGMDEPTNEQGDSRSRIVLAIMELAWQHWWSISLNGSDGTNDSDGLGGSVWSKKRVNTDYYWSGSPTTLKPTTLTARISQ